MKNLFALLFVAGTLSFVACGEKKDEASSESVVDSSATVVESSEMVMDSSAIVVDSTASDSLKK